MSVGAGQQALPHGLSRTGAPLADANEARDWRIYAEFAQRLISRARRLYAHEGFGVELDHTVYALDATTIDLCLSMFPWAHFRSSQAAVKPHTLLDLRDAIPSFIHISDGKLHDVNVLDLLLPEPGAFYVMDRGYLDFSRLYRLDQAGSFFVTRAKRNMNARRAYSATVDRRSGLVCDQAAEKGPPMILKGAVEGSTTRFMGDEHLAVIVPEGKAAPAHGEQVILTPPHCDPTVNLYETYHVVKGDTLVDIWPVTARGRSR